MVFICSFISNRSYCFSCWLLLSVSFIYSTKTFSNSDSIPVLFFVSLNLSVYCFIYFSMSLRALKIGLFITIEVYLMYFFPSLSEVFSISSAILFIISSDSSSLNSFYISIFYLLYDFMNL